VPDPHAPLRAAYAAWAAGRPRFDQQAERLISGEDAAAWTHSKNGAVVPPSDRLRILRMGFDHVNHGTSDTLRGGVMYAVAREYRVPPPAPGSEAAAIAAAGDSAETPGRNRAGEAANPALAPIRAALNGGPPSAPPAPPPAAADDALIRAWEEAHPKECARLRTEVADQLELDTKDRAISAAALRGIGLGMYRAKVLELARASPPPPPKAKRRKSRRRATAGR
jgi:hypothetical protein